VKRAIWIILGTSIWSLAAGLAAYQYTVPWAVFAAVCGSLSGVLAGKTLAVSRLRFPFIWGLGLLSLAPALGLALLIKRSAMASGILGPPAAFTLSEM
jgi:hypothetical protein